MSSCPRPHRIRAQIRSWPQNATILKVTSTEPKINAVFALPLIAKLIAEVMRVPSSL
jgi:hypothetical protein